MHSLYKKEERWDAFCSDPPAGFSSVLAALCLFEWLTTNIIHFLVHISFVKIPRRELDFSCFADCSLMITNQSVLWESPAQMKNGFLPQEPHNLLTQCLFIFVFDSQYELGFTPTDKWLVTDIIIPSKNRLRRGSQAWVSCKILFDSIYLPFLSYLFICHLACFTGECFKKTKRTDMDTKLMVAYQTPVKSLI